MSEQLYKNATPNEGAEATGEGTENNGGAYNADYKVEDDDKK